MVTLDIHESSDNDIVDQWMKDELERTRQEFVDRLEFIIMEYSKKKFGKLGQQIARNIVVNIGIEVK